MAPYFDGWEIRQTILYVWIKDAVRQQHHLNASDRVNPKIFPKSMIASHRLVEMRVVALNFTWGLFVLWVNIVFGINN